MDLKLFKFLKGVGGGGGGGGGGAKLNSESELELIGLINAQLLERLMNIHNITLTIRIGNSHK